MPGTTVRVQPLPLRRLSKPQKKSLCTDMQVNWPGPHTPFIVTKDMMDSTRTRSFVPPVDYYHGPNSVADNIVARRLYAAEVENLDSWFGKYIHAVEQLGDAPSTVICISSDHVK